MQQALFLIVATSLTLTVAEAGLQVIVAQEGSPDLRAGLFDSTGIGPRPVTPADIVAHRDLMEVRLSPSGREVAYLVKQALLDSNTYRYILSITSTKKGLAPSKRFEGSAASHLRWSPDGSSLWFLSVEAGAARLLRMASESGVPQDVLAGALSKNKRLEASLEVSISAFEFSPTGRHVALIGGECPRPATRDSSAQQGIVYNDETMTSYDLIRRSWRKCPIKLWLYDVESRSIRRLWKAADGIGRLAWSPDERSIAISYATPPVQRQSTVFWNQDIGIVTVGTGAFKVIATTETVDDYPVWSPDSKYLGFLSISTDRSSVAIVNIGSGQRQDMGGGFGRAVRELWWDGASSRLIVEAADSGTIPRGKSALYSLSLANHAKEEISPPVGHLSGCSFGSGFTRAACILQSVMSPPDPVLIEMERREARRLVELNPHWRHLQLGQIEERTWTNSYGALTNGFLVKPVGYLKGRRYPLLVVLYGFEGKFISDAEWITSYPVQSFAGAGYAVLLVNYPHAKPWLGRNFAVGSVAEGFSPLASIRRGVDLLVGEGIADSERLGILGWSYGAFLTEFALTWSNIFKAASVGNGGDYNPGVYWLLGHRPIRDRYEQVMGGPPYGATLTNWLRFSPALNAHRIRAPILMEFSSEEALYGLEMFTALRRSGTPVELIVYPDEGHSLSQPRHRYYSMLRQLDWFDFWLQGRHLAHARDDRFQRWREMRHQLQALPRSGR